MLSHVRRASGMTQNHHHFTTYVNNRHRHPSEKTNSISFTIFTSPTSCVGKMKPYLFRLCRCASPSLEATNRLKPLAHPKPHDAHDVSSTDRSLSNQHSAHLVLPTAVSNTHSDRHQFFLFHQAYIQITTPSSRSERLCPHHLRTISRDSRFNSQSSLRCSVPLLQPLQLSVTFPSPHVTRPFSHQST